MNDSDITTDFTTDECAQGITELNQAFELTAQQKQLWPETGYLHIQWHIPKQFDKATIEQALQTLLNTHDSLRHSYTEQAGLVYPLQSVIDANSLSANQFDANDYSDFGFCAQLENLKNGYQLTMVLSPLNADLYSIGLLHQQLNALLQRSTELSITQSIIQPQADYQQFSHWQAQCLDPQITDEEEHQAALALIKNTTQNSGTDILDTIDFYKPDANADADINISQTRKTKHTSMTLTQGKQIHDLAAQLDISVEALLVTVSCISQFVQANQYNVCERLQIDVSLPCRPFDELTTVTGRLSKNSRLAIDHYATDTISQLATRVGQLLSQHQHLAEYLPGTNSHGKFLQSYLALHSNAELNDQLNDSENITLNQITDVTPCAVAFTLIDHQTHIDAHLEIKTEQQNAINNNDLQGWQVWLQRFQSILTHLIDRNVHQNSEHSIDTLKTALAKTQNQAQYSRTLEQQLEQQIVTQAQGPQTDYSNRHTIIGAIAHFASTTPQNIATVYDDQNLNYHELYQRVLALAETINHACVNTSELAVDRNDVDRQVVAINLPRGINYLVAMLACMAANKAFVPLETQNNSPRLQSLIEKINPALVIDNSLLYQTSCAQTGNSVRASKHQLNPNSLAYIIYTSGTTGEPKGVQISHGNLHNYAHSLCDHLQLSSPAVQQPKANEPFKAACVSTLSADLGYSALFSTWLIGGSVHLLPMSHAVDETLYRNYLTSHQIDMVKMVPSHLQTLIDNAVNFQQGSDNQQQNNDLQSNIDPIAALIPKQHLILGGETLTLKLLEQLLTTIDCNKSSNIRCNIHNHYGPSEATIGCFAINYSKIDSEQLHTSKQLANSAPIGKALSNVQFAVVDEKQRAVPLFAQGELIIGGAGVSSGYQQNHLQQHQNNQDQNRFIDFDFGMNANVASSTEATHPNMQRAYRSGDKVRLLPNGCLEFLGRLDGQVKLRGYRVELPAIEQQILKLDEITGVCVKLHQPLIESDKKDQQKGQKTPTRLVCWYSVNPNSTIDETQLKAHLNAHLPDYMCPSQWIALKQMPLTPNGKINRKALPDPCLVLAEQHHYCPPKTPTEQLLAKLWQQLLGTGDIKIGQHDDFFALGGNSLIATQVVANLRQKTGLKINLADLFDRPTLVGQSAYIDTLTTSQLAHAATHTLPATVQKVALAGTHPLSYAQQRLWFLDQLNPNSGFYNVPAQIRFTHTTGNLAGNPVNVEHLEHTLNQLMQHHPALRSRFSLNGQNQPQQYLSDEPLVIERLTTGDVNAIASQGFDLLNQPLMRAHWLTEQNTLLITLHHIISDAWSTDLLLKHFVDAYHHRPLATENYRFIDHCHWQHQSQTQALMTQQLAFWTQKLHGAEQYVEVPNDNIRPEYQTYQGARLSTTLNSDALAKLDALCQQHQVSRFMLLACGFNLLLNHYSGQQDISIAIPVAGRNQVGFEHTVGLFLNTLVLRSQLSQTFTPGALLEQIKRTSLALFDNQDLPFDRLIRELSTGNQSSDRHTIKRATSYTPFNQVCLNVLNTPLGKSAKSLAIEGAEFIGVQNHSAKYDFEWIVSEKADKKVIENQQLDILVEYNTDLFRPSTINKMLADFVQILIHLPERLNAPISQLLTKQTDEQTDNTPIRDLTPAQLDLAKWRQQTLAHCVVINPALCHTKTHQNTASIKSITLKQAALTQTALKQAALKQATTATMIASCALALSAFSNQADPFIVSFSANKGLAQQHNHNLLIDIKHAKQQGHSIGQWITNIEQQLALEKRIPLAQTSTVDDSTISLTIGDKSTTADVIFDGQQLTASHNKFNPLVALSHWLYHQISQQIDQNTKHIDQSQRELTSWEQLQWVTPAEQQALFAWGQGPDVIVSDDLITQLNHQAAKSPNAIAITQGKQSVNYAQLQQRSNQLAHCLQGKGIGFNQIVAIDASTSPQEISSSNTNQIHAGQCSNIDWMIMMLAIIKTGAAYLPLDAKLPIARKQQIIADAKVELVLNAKHPWFIHADAYPSDDLHPFSSPDGSPSKSPRETPLYVLYTSGSTGEPKGAIVTHASEQNLVSWYQHEYQINAQDRCLIASSTSFDLTQKNLFTTLCVGASLHFPDMQQFDADCVVDTIATMQITLINCAPSAFYSLLSVTQDDSWQKFDSLQYVLLGGEPVDLSRIIPRLGQSNCQLVNMYGPTECTDIATAYTLSDELVNQLLEKTSPNNQLAQVQLPIGRPSGGVELYVLDNEQKMLPQGMVGELYIGGAGVGLGYLNRPEKTATSFILNPYQHGSKNENLKRYKSGDLVYIDDNQQLIFVGRNDHQIKHRGFRIELNAINASLNQHPQVLRAATQVIDQQLVAFYQPKEPVQASSQITTALKTFASEQLPHYMVPEQWQLVTHMPLSKNGKLDLIALANTYTDSIQIANAKPTTKPTNPRQIWLAQLWQQLFNENASKNNAQHQTISVESDFFACGGHSLIATQLASRIRKETGLDLPLTLLFEHSRLDEMASAIDALATQAKKPPLVAIHKQTAQPHTEKDTQYPLSSAQQRLWFIQQLNPNDASYNMSSYLRFDTDTKTDAQTDIAVNITALSSALLALVERHMSLRSCFIRTCFMNDSTEETVYQRIMPVPEMLLNCHYLPNDDIDQLMDTASAAANQPFNLSKDLMLRANLYNDKLLQLTIHHIASDGWSMGIIIKELAALYQHFAAQSNGPTSGQSAQLLAPLPIQYVDYAHWQQQQLNAQRMVELNRFWQHNLVGAPTLMSLPLDNKRPTIATSNGARVDCHIDFDALNQLNEIATTTRATTFMATLAVFDVLMHHWTGQTDIVVGTDLANREHAELENLIGFFVNLLPTRLDLSGNPSFRQILTRARKQCLGVYQHQDMPFDKLVELVNPKRSQSHHPLVQVLCVLQNAPKTELALNAKNNSDKANLTITPIEPAKHSTRFELGLFVTQTPQGLSGHWSYNTDVFEQQTIIKLNQQFKRLFTQLCQAPDAPISTVKCDFACTSTNTSTNTSNNSSQTPKSVGQTQRRRRLAGLKRA